VRIVADRELCIGAGQCVRYAPTVFDQDVEDGIVVVLKSAPAEDQRDEVDEAIEVCPAQAIWLEEAGAE
jgi:ferredoxin